MKLSDTQAIILAKAAQHPEGLILPPPTPPAPRAQIARKFSMGGIADAVTLAASDAAFAWRTDADGTMTGLRITDAGMRAIGIEPEAIAPAAAETPTEALRRVITEAILEPTDAPAAEGPTDADEAGREEVFAAAVAYVDAAATMMGAAMHDNAPPMPDSGGAIHDKAAPTQAEQRRGIASRAVRKAVRADAMAAEAKAARGELPAPPDFSADTHKPYRAKLAKLIEMAEAGDVAGLRAMAINPTSTSPKALIRFRDLAIRALEARAAK